MNRELLQVKNYEVVTSSLVVAESFNKNHSDVMRKVEKLNSELKGYQKFYRHPLFEKSTEQNEQNGEYYPVYYMNRDGFTLLAMGFTGADALKWKLQYINAFNEMEKQLKNTAPVLPDNRMEIAKLFVDAPKDRLPYLKSIYSDYFNTIDKNSFEYIADANSSYRRWIEDLHINEEYVRSFPTTDIYYQFVRYCNDNHFIVMGKKTFFKTLEYDFQVMKKQKADGFRYFLPA